MKISKEKKRKRENASKMIKKQYFEPVINQAH